MNKGHVYVIKLQNDNLVKIGCTTNFKNRLETLQTAVPFRLKDFWVSDSFFQYRDAERTLLSIFEPFQSDGGTECFCVSFDNVKNVAIGICKAYTGNVANVAETEEEKLESLGKTRIENLINEWCIGRNGLRDRHIMKLHYIDGLSYYEIKNIVYKMFECDLSIDRIKKTVSYRTKEVLMASERTSEVAKE